MTKKTESPAETWRSRFDDREQKEISFALDTVAFEADLPTRPEQYLPGQELRHVIAALAQTLDNVELRSNSQAVPAELHGDLPQHFALQDYHGTVIATARHYRDNYAHGTEGHNALLIIAKLADLAGL